MSNTKKMWSSWSWSLDEDDDNKSNNDKNDDGSLTDDGSLLNQKTTAPLWVEPVNPRTLPQVNDNEQNDLPLEVASTTTFSSSDASSNMATIMHAVQPPSVMKTTTLPTMEDTTMPLLEPASLQATTGTKADNRKQGEPTETQQNMETTIQSRTTSNEAIRFVSVPVMKKESLIHQAKRRRMPDNEDTGPPPQVQRPTMTTTTMAKTDIFTTAPSKETALAQTSLIVEPKNQLYANMVDEKQETRTAVDPTTTADAIAMNIFGSKEEERNPTLTGTSASSCPNDVIMAVLGRKEVTTIDTTAMGSFDEENAKYELVNPISPTSTSTKNSKTLVIESVIDEIPAEKLGIFDETVPTTPMTAATMTSHSSPDSFQAEPDSPITRLVGIARMVRNDGNYEPLLEDDSSALFVNKSGAGAMHTQSVRSKTCRRISVVALLGIIAVVLLVVFLAVTEADSYEDRGIASISSGGGTSDDTASSPQVSSPRPGTLVSQAPSISRPTTQHPTAIPTGSPTVSNSPSISPRPTSSMSPSTMPSKEKVCFESTQELRDTVDDYLVDPSGSVTKDLYGHPIGNWCVSRISDFSSLFDADRNPLAIEFNEDISMWDVSGATSMERMFQGAWSLDQDFSQWNVSSVVNLAWAFSNAVVFNGDISNWNTNNVVNISGTFSGAQSFNRPLNWDVSKVTDMSRTFSDTKEFNQPLQWPATSNVVDMSGIFENSLAFNADVSSLDVSNVVDMNSAFYGAITFNQPLQSWNVEKVEDFSFGFARCDNFNQDISAWNVAKASSMKNMFRQAAKFNQDLSSWSVRNADLSNMFLLARDFNQDLCSWGRQMIQSSSESSTEWLFSHTDCPETDPPDLASNPPGPFCHICG